MGLLAVPLPHLLVVGIEGRLEVAGNSLHHVGEVEQELNRILHVQLAEVARLGPSPKNLLQKLAIISVYRKVMVILGSFTFLAD